MINGTGNQYSAEVNASIAEGTAISWEEYRGVEGKQEGKRAAESSNKVWLAAEKKLLFTPEQSL